jgi:LPXTG-motif cell wall-anchored protein
VKYGDQTRKSIARVAAAITLAALAVVLLPATTASAQDTQTCDVDIGDYEGTAVISVTPLEVEAGGTVTIAGAGFPPGVVVPLSVNGTVFAQPVTDATGAFSVQYTVPADMGPGTITFEALCGAFTFSTELTVIGGQGVVTTVPLPVTGTDHTMEFLQIAAVLLILGALLIFLSRRQARRRELSDSVRA